MNIDKVGIVLYVIAKPNISGKVPHIDIYIINGEPSLFSRYGLIKEPIEPAKTNKKRAKPM